MIVWMVWHQCDITMSLVSFARLGCILVNVCDNHAAGLACTGQRCDTGHGIAANHACLSCATCHA